MYLFEKATNVIGFIRTGSRYICDPPVENTDEDFVIFTANKKQLQIQLQGLGYVLSIKDIEKYKADETDPFAMYNIFDAYRHPSNAHNLIVVNRADDFLRWKVATMVAKELNLRDKQHRVMLFRAIRSGGTIFDSSEKAEAADHRALVR